MHHVGQDMAAQYPAVADAKSMGRLHITQLADLESLGTNQTAQAGPTGQAQDKTQGDKAGVCLLHTYSEEIRVEVYIDLEQQHRCRNQQDARNGAEGGIQVLHHIIHPAFEVARHHTQGHGDGQHNQGRQCSQQHPGAHALDALVSHIRAALVGAQHVVVAADVNQPESHADYHRLHAPGGVPGMHAGPQQVPLQPHYQRCRQQAPAQCLDAEREYIAPFVSGTGQVLPGVLEIGVVTYHVALLVLHIALLEGLEREGSRVGALEAIPHAIQQHIQHTGYLVVIEHLRGIHPLWRGQGAPEMQRVKQGDAHVNHDDSKGHHAQARGEHPAPAFPGLGVVAQAVKEQGQHNDQHKHQRVRPQQDWFESQCFHQLSRTLGSAQV